MESREQLEHAAATWIARRDVGPWTAEDRQALSSWLAESAGHRAVYYRLNAAWHEAGRLEVLKGSAASIAPSPMGPMPKAVGVVDALDSGHKRDRSAVARCLMAIRRLSKPAIGIAATLLLHMGVAAYLWLHGQHHPDHYITALGELESIPMPDGSRVTLNTDSILRIDLKRSVRRIELEHGEAFFEVAKDPQRPFIVTAGDRMIIAVGTQFSVRREGNDVRVIVSEGRVRMEPLQRATAPAREIGTEIARQNALWSAGTVAQIQEDSVSLQEEEAAEIDESLSWRIGLLTFHDTPLASAITEFNRYNARKVLIQDPFIAVIPVSGVFRTTQLAPFIHLLEQRFPIQATVEEDRVVLSALSRDH